MQICAYTFIATACTVTSAAFVFMLIICAAGGTLFR